MLEKRCNKEDFASTHSTLPVSTNQHGRHMASPPHRVPSRREGQFGQTSSPGGPNYRTVWKSSNAVTPLPNYGNALLLLRVGPRRPIASGTPPNRFPTGASANALYTTPPPGREFSRYGTNQLAGQEAAGRGERESEGERERGGGKSKGRAAQGRRPGRERIRAVSPAGLS